MLIKFAVRDF